MERLQKVIAKYGYASRREAEKLIKGNKVLVNDELVTELGTKVSSTDIIKINGKIINKEVNREYYLLNKPREVVSTREDPEKRITVVDLINTDERIYPVGRLDYNTTGLIILTNDGDFANYIASPRNEVTKTYLAKLNKILTIDDLKKIKKGILIDKTKVNIGKIKIKNKNIEKNTCYVELTIVEGRNHIIKRLFQSLGYTVLKLTRIKIGHLSIDNLQSGEYRKLKIKEVKRFYGK